MIDLLLPWPVSLNSLYRAIRGRNIMSARYRQWVDDANVALDEQSPVEMVPGTVQVIVSLFPPTRRAYDPDNHVKCVLDFIVSHGLIDGDSNATIKLLTVQPNEHDITQSGAWVHVEPYEESA